MIADLPLWRQEFAAGIERIKRRRAQDETMITQHGPQCDVCGNYILPGFSGSINPFSVPGIKGTLVCHDDCRTKIENVKDWRVLPTGPLRAVFENQEKTRTQEETMTFTLDKTDEGWVLTIENTRWVYARLKQALKKIEALAVAQGGAQ